MSQIKIQNSVLLDASGHLELYAVLIAERQVDAIGGAPGNWTDREFKTDFAEMTSTVEEALAGYDVDQTGVIHVTEWENGASDLAATARLAVEYHVRARIAKTS